MLEGIEVRLNVDYLADRESLNALADKVVYTGPVDAYFGYRLGALQYRSVRFETEVLDIDNYQGNAVVNYTDAETPYTRTVSYTHLDVYKRQAAARQRRACTGWCGSSEHGQQRTECCRTGPCKRTYRQLLLQPPQWQP